MSIERVHDLADHWSSDDAVLEKPLEDAFDHIGFTEDFVESALATPTRAGASERVIKDSIWGMVTADAATCRVLDTPLLQRLRNIRQLGLSYLIYPTAEHSRFAHSLGVVHVVQRFMDAFAHPRATLSSNFCFANLNATERDDLRHSALLHDVGHFPFSHVVEKIVEHGREGPFSADKALALLLDGPEECLAKTVSLAESVSLAIVLSKRFRRFYSAIRVGDPEAAFRVAALIAGFRTDPANRALPDIVSSGLDADKIDYLCRDSAACLIPIGIDVSRVFLRSSLVSVPVARIPEPLISDRDPAEGNVTFFMVNASGIDTVEELTTARAGMYQRVYLHPTTKSAERLLARAITDNLESANPSFQGIFDLWRRNDASLLETLHESERQRKSSNRPARDLLARRLPKRAALFGVKTIGPLVQPASFLAKIQPDHVKRLRKQVTGSTLEPLRETALDVCDLRALEARVAQEAERLRDLLRSKSSREQVPEGGPPIVTLLPIPDLLGGRTAPVPVLERSGEIASSSDYLTAPELMDAALLAKALGSVYTEPDWREIVFIAARNVLYDFPHDRKGKLPKRTAPPALDLYPDDSDTHYPVKFLQRARIDWNASTRRTKLNGERVRVLSHRLASIGDYDNKPQLAPGQAPDAETAAVAKALAPFDGQHDWRVTPDSVRSFLEQFPYGLRKEARQMLQRIVFLDRARLKSALVKAIGQAALHAETKDIVIAPLSPNSGYFVKMLLEQETRREFDGYGWQFQHSLQEAVDHVPEKGLIALVDDNSSSGSQACAQLLAWAGINRMAWPLELRSERNIDEHAAPKKLGGLSIAICVAAGTPGARKKVGDLVEKEGLARFKGLFYKEEVASTQEAFSPEMSAFLTRVGQELLARARFNQAFAETDPEGKKACARDALGYDGMRGLLATHFNVPASTVTALWCPGIFNDAPWVPLLIRRGYFQNLVLG